MFCFTKRGKAKKINVESRRSAAQLPFDYLMRVPILSNLKTRHHTDHSDYFIHGTAGWQNMTATNFFKMFLRMGYCTDYMEEDGQIFVQRPWHSTGAHLGKGKLFGKRIGNSKGAGLEIAVGGILTKKSDGYYTWFGKKVAPVRVRHVKKEVGGYHATGAFEMLTEAQERSLIRFIRDMHEEYGTKFYSHDDVSGYRGKTDLGGCLSLPFQQFLKKSLDGGEHGTIFYKGN